jgi:hypothetical protein
LSALQESALPLGRLELGPAGCEPGDGAANDDVVGGFGPAAWVIDGATGLGDPLLPGPSDAAWYAQSLDRALRQAFESEPESPTPALLRRAVAEVRADFEKQRLRAPAGAHENPSAAFVMIRAVDDAVELTSLGDCQAIYAEPSKRAAVRPQRADAAGHRGRQGAGRALRRRARAEPD